MQKSLRSDFDMAYERGRISVSADEGNTPPAKVISRCTYKINFTLCGILMYV